MKIHLEKQAFEVEKSFGVTINQFTLSSPFKIDDLIHLNILDEALRPNHINDRVDKDSFLKGLFISNKLSTEDFKYILGNGIIYYLEGFSDSEEEWGEDKSAFKTLLGKFIKFTENSLNGCYLINKEWFSKHKEKVRSREYDLYDFYFIIIWVDKKNATQLYISEWCGD